MKKKILGQVLLSWLISVFFLTIPSGNTLCAQTNDVRVTLDLQGVTLEKAINAMEKQTSFLFTIGEGVNLQQLVSLKVKDAPLTAALDQLISGTNLSYTIRDQFVVLTAKPAPVAKTVKGIVTDQTGQPVPGVSVFVKGTTLGTTTDLDGNFLLTIPGEMLGGRLVFSSIGYAEVEMSIGNRRTFDVTMQEASVELEATVVTALGIRRDQKALSYNVQEVKADQVTTVKDANFINSLNGKVAGVTINASSSGVGGASKVVLRGNKSISQSSNALYVIDGVPMYNFGGGGGTEFDSKGATESIADINPEDIESISVLTGAAAAALYGSEAANGAIMITTKKGQAGKMNVTFSSDTEFLSPFVLPEFQSRYGTGLNGKSGDQTFSWGAYLPESARYNYNPRDFFQTGTTYTNAFSLSGGTDKNQTYFSAAAVNSDGIIPNNKYDRYNFTFRNTTYFLHDKLRLDFNGSYILQKDQNMTNQGVYANPLTSIYLFPRGNDFSVYQSYERYNPGTKMMEQFWSDALAGDLRMQNPYWIAYRNLRNNNKHRYMLNLTASYDILDWLNVAGRVKVDNASNIYTQKLFATTEPTISEGGSNGHYTEARTEDAQVYADIIANINKTFGEDWSLVANIGASINNIKTNTLTYGGPIQADGLANVFNVMDLDNVKSRASKSGWNDETQSIFASVEVGWKKMLYLTLTGRNDWASQLAGSSSMKSGFFYPSVGLSWVPTSHWELGPVTYLKVRGSIAEVGMPYQRFLTMETYEYDAISRIWKDKTHYPIGDLKPENTRTWEIGLETRLWQDVSLNASWYLADTYNQTFDPQLPPSSAYSTMYLQTGSVRNTGVEIAAGYGHTWGKFSWDSNFTWSWNRNRIRALAEDAVNPVTGEKLNIDELRIKGLGKAIYILKKGGTLGDLYTTSSIASNQDGYIELDNEGKPLMIETDKEIYLGTVFPKNNMAWRNDFTFAGLHLGILFSGRIGGICYSATQANLDLYGVSEASAAARDAGGVLVNGREWVDPQKWYQQLGSQSGLPQYYTYSATNFRLQELSLGYTLPKKWFRNVMSATVSLVGNNLWMIYCKAPFDPESVATTGNNYQGIDYFMMPSLRRIGFNVKLTF
jgi:TonB-linked SusC/RagA family outer membrane protein